MTGLAENYRYEKIIEEGASDFVEKPVRIQEILVRLKRVLRERAITIELKRSYGKLRRILWETVEALASALEKRDPYTAGHQKRVAKLGCALAEELGFSEKQIEGIQVAGNLHDIGKLSIPTDILNKPGQLSTNEFNLIKEHSQVGYEILVDIEFDQPISQIILQHHERMNGSGYPRGLSGEDIIAEARVLAVADVVESMVSHRPYRPALGLDRALAEISQNRGSHFDPTVADTCLKLCASGRFVFE
ncbi:MAG TPA: HD domain-containing protein [bacterium]|nr:HD domain-containing protein [bacterium]